MGRRFVVSDLHGGYKGLMEVFKKAKFDHKNDKLIFLGDSLDGWDEHDKIIDEFLKIKDFVFIMGNHDFIMLEWLNTGVHQFQWTHGGDAVIRAYERINKKDYKIINSMRGYTTTLKPSDVPQHHKDFYNSAVTHYQEGNDMFLHAGFNWNYTIEDHRPQDSLDTFAWEGQILYHSIMAHRQGGALEFKDKSFRRVFVGHTPTINYGYDTPFIGMNLVGMDTGGCFKGKISMMDIDTLTTYQSTEVYKLYPNQKGRN